MNRQVVVRVFGAALLLATTACSQEPPQVAVAEQWTDAMRRLDMLGLYPLSEDVQIGDVFLIARRRDDEGADSAPRFRTARIGTVSPGIIERMLAQQEETRLRIRWQAPTRPSAAPSSAPNATVTITASGGSSATATVRPGSPAAPTRPVAPPSAGTAPPERFFVREVGSTEEGKPRLRRLAVPALVAARLSEVQLGVAGVFGNLAGALGLASSSQVAVTIRLRNLASLAVDDYIAERFLATERRRWAQRYLPPHLLVRYVRSVDGESARLLCQGDAAALERQDMTIAVANQVVYASRIEYEFNRSTTTALLGGTNVVALLSQSAAVAIPSIPAAVPAGTPGVADPGAIVAQLRAAQDALAQSLPTSPGARVSLGIGSFGGLSLNEDFPIPVAVGVGTPIYYRVSRSVIATGATEEAANNALAAGLRACALMLELPSSDQFFTAAELPPELVPLRNLICANSRADNQREQVANPTAPVDAIPTVCTPQPAARQQDGVATAGVVMALPALPPLTRSRSTA